MKKTTKAWLLTAAFLMLAGLILFAAVMTELDWDFTALSTENYSTKTYEIKEPFGSICVHTDSADIAFVLSENGKCSVECYEEEKLTHFVSVENDTLVIAVQDERAWYDHIGLLFGEAKLTVNLPKAAYDALSVQASTGDVALPEALAFDSVDVSVSTGDIEVRSDVSGLLKLKTSTGAIRAAELSAGKMELSASTGGIELSDVGCEGEVQLHVSTGKTVLTNVECKTLVSGGSTGDVELQKVTAEEKITVRRSTGDVCFDHSDAAELFVETDTGDVNGSLLTEKIFFVHADTGSVTVPQTTGGGRCEIITDTGDIKLMIAEP